MPSKKAKVLRTFVLELLVIKDRPAQRERPGTQKAVEGDTLASVLLSIILMVRETRAYWSKDEDVFSLGSFQ